MGLPIHDKKRPTPAKLDVLVVIDNCNRQCLGLPIFPSGPKVTSQEYDYYKLRHFCNKYNSGYKI
jgi:hypothetical protein